MTMFDENGNRIVPEDKKKDDVKTKEKDAKKEK